VANTGLIEVPFGATLREVVFDIGGGITTTGQGDRERVQGGADRRAVGRLPDAGAPGPAAGLRFAAGAGAMVGSGGLVAMNQQTCMVSIARFFMDFTQRESCGKCVLCREGTRQMLALLDDIIEGRATAETLDLLEKLAGRCRRARCAAGQDGAEPGAVDAAVFPRGVRRARVSQALSDGPVQGAGQAGDRRREVQGLHGVREEVPGGRDHGREEAPHIIDQESASSAAPAPPPAN
jgi:NADH-quinone oxidoreductase subunit F